MKHFSKKSMLYSLLGLLGFSSCDNEAPEMYGPMVMYGPIAPSYNFVSTHVTDENGQPIKGIRSIMEISAGGETIFVKDTAFTDYNGIAVNKTPYSSSYYPDEHSEITLKYDDVDGAVNGSFESKEEKIAFKDLPEDITIHIKLEEKK